MITLQSQSYYWQHSASNPSPSLSSFLLALLLIFNPQAYPNSNPSTSPSRVSFHLIVLMTSKCMMTSNLLITDFVPDFFIAFPIRQLLSPMLKKTKTDAFFQTSMFLCWHFHYFTQCFAASVGYPFSLLHRLYAYLHIYCCLSLKYFISLSCTKQVFFSFWFLLKIVIFFWEIFT